MAISETINETRAEYERSSEKQMEDLGYIAKGIKRVQELFEMRCEDHAELTRYATQAATYPSIENLKALQATIAMQSAKWRGLGVESTGMGSVPDEDGGVPHRGHFR